MINIQLLLKDLYVTPTISFYSTYEVLESSRKEVKSSIFFEKREGKSTDEIFTEVLSKRKGLILSEPGYGKTRLFRELKKYTKKIDLIPSLLS